MMEWTDRLNKMKLREFPGLFSTLEVPGIAAFKGRYQGSFVGPAWLRKAAGPMLVFTGLGGWWGKRFKGDGSAANLVQREGQLQEKFPMSLVEITSLIDGKPGLALHYHTANPFPWPYIADELRLLSPGSYLGMTYLKIRPFHGLILPFLLEAEE
jgi:hypothetical protein